MKAHFASATAVRRSAGEPYPAVQRHDQEWDAELAQDWWERTVFGKTFIEARSSFMLFRWVL